MADSKITALTNLTAADPVNDMFPVVDVSDTSMAASGTTKRISVNNILGASGTATLASATITGALDAARLNVTGATIPSNGVYLGSANNLSFSAASTLAMTLNSTGLGIGVSPATKFHVKGGLPVFRLDNSSTGLNQFDTGVDSLGAYFRTYVVDGIRWYNNAGGIPMTLNASGNLLVARTVGGLDNTSGITIGQSSIGMQTEGNQIQIIANRTTSDGAIVDIRRNNVSVGTIAVTTTATAYNTSSDYRLKEAAQPLVGGLARVNSLKPSIYKWKADGSAGEGFIAHELVKTVPLAVTGDKDAVDADGKPAYQGVDLSKLVPILVAAIQELTAEVNALKNA